MHTYPPGCVRTVLFREVADELALVSPIRHVPSTFTGTWLTEGTPVARYSMKGRRPVYPRREQMLITIGVVVWGPPLLVMA